MLDKILSNLQQLDYERYLTEFRINELDGIKTNAILTKEIKKWETIDPNNLIPSPPEFDDLIRLHYLVSLLKSRVVLEFGVGKSTSVLIDAIKLNQSKYSEYVNKNLRISNPWSVYSVDNSEYWLNKVKSDISDSSNWHPHFSEFQMGECNSRICTYYSNLPNIRPDFYLFRCSPSIWHIRKYSRYNYRKSGSHAYGG